MTKYYTYMHNSKVKIRVDLNHDFSFKFVYFFYVLDSLMHVTCFMHILFCLFQMLQ